MPSEATVNTKQVTKRRQLHFETIADILRDIEQLAAVTSETGESIRADGNWTPALIDAIAVSIKDQAPDAIVLGLPLNMDGTEGPQAKLAREFGEQLHKRCGLEVHYHDERLTSFAADQQMAGSGRTHKQKKRLRDALAAAEILRDFLAHAD